MQEHGGQDERRKSCVSMRRWQTKSRKIEGWVVVCRVEEEGWIWLAVRGEKAQAGMGRKHSKERKLGNAQAR